jgi:hypothetical protein
LADHFQWISLALLLRWSGPIAVTCVSDALRQVMILAAFAVEEDEGIFRPLDVILVTLLWSTFADIGDSGTPATMRALGSSRYACR